MKRIDYAAGCKMLQEAGFTAAEIEHLNKLRSSYEEQEIDSTTTTQQHQMHTSLFRRVLHVLLDICITLATSSDTYWMHDHFLY